ncbi:MAG: deoxyribodipyrimidine photolyase [Lentisphaerae bacterium]|nr:deoxyribodipyrimidine photolyase [Lentisphaerota bacterium]MCP4102866.1 deoxyribodipyrimidine photolyase [Lentisphaerota bacterium]
MIPNERVKILKSGTLAKGKYVLYWMQTSQRTEYNHALEFAVREANDSQLPLLVYFGLTSDYPDANIRHYRFMLEGLKQTAAKLKRRGINFVLRLESPEKGIVKLAKNAAVTIFDTGYMPIQRAWRQEAAALIKCPVVQVESDIIVPAKTASSKEEYAAYTIRSKINKYRDYFMQPLEEHEVKCKTKLDFESLDFDAPTALVNSLKIDKSVLSVEDFHPGGTNEAQKRLAVFIDNKLHKYTELRNIPTEDYQSGLSPYIHFGQISPLQIALEAKKTGLPDVNDFLEELIIRRELAINFAFYNSSCQDYSALPPWVQTTLNEHISDKREYIYSIEDLENAKTHDPYWDAAQKEMTVTGKMHGYIRMYWGKMILQWSSTPQNAFRIVLKLNDKYELDGRDPNSCAGVAWCFGKHDRPWPIGKVRLMNQNGLKRKFNADAYARKINLINN